MKQTQKEAVYTAIVSVLKDHGVVIREGQNVSTIMTREFRAIVNAILVQGFKSGKIELETQFANDSDLKAYVSGLQSNWLRKDKRLNGNVKYKPANPGSRTGGGDAQLKALRQLMSSLTSAHERAEVQHFIDQRVAEINASKPPKTPKIDFTQLPAMLAKKYAARVG